MRSLPTVPSLDRTILLISLLCATGMAHPPRADACVDYQEYAHQVAYRTMPGDVRVAAIAGNVLYLATPTSFQVLDISDGADPETIGSLDWIGDPRAIAVSGSYAYIASGPDGLMVIKISEPTAPSLVGHLTVKTEALDVVVSGDHAYVAAGVEGICVVDIHDPSAPLTIGRVDTPGQALRLDVEGEWAYIADDVDLRVADISDPRHPVLVGCARWNGRAADVAVRDRRAYVADPAWGLRVLDMSVPGSTNPETQKVTLGGNCTRVNVVGNCAFVLNGDEYNSTLFLVDVDPSSPPTLVGQVTVLGAKNDFCADDRLACVAGGWRGFSMVDVARPGSPPIVGHVQAQTGALAVTAKGDYAYVGYPYWIYFWIVDVSDPAHPRTRGSVHGSGWGAAIALMGHHAIVAGRSTGMCVIDVADPDHPFLVGTHDIAGHPSDVAVYGQYGLFPAGTLRVVDFADPANPRVVGSVVPPGGASGVEVIDHYACTSASDMINMIDLTDPSDPTVVGTLQVGRTIRGIAVSGDHVYAATAQGFYVVDASDPANPRVASDVPDADFCDGISAYGSHVYVSGNRRGVLIYDVSDPEHPFQCGSQDTPYYAYNVSVTPDFTYQADGDGGFNVVNTQCQRLTPTPVAERDAGAGVELQFGAPMPNPFESEIAIDFTLANRGNIELQIFSTSGRAIRTLAHGEYAPGNWHVTWDGTTDAGRPTPAGVYFCRLTQGTVMRTVRLARVR